MSTFSTPVMSFWSAAGDTCEAPPTSYPSRLDSVSEILRDRLDVKMRNNGCGLWGDRRGAVAFEAPFVFGLLVLGLLLPLADFAVAGFKLISGYEALRNTGQYIQYHAPPDVTNWSSWAASLPAAVKAPGGYTISNINVWCGDSSKLCSSTNTASPKYYSMTTSVTLTPMVLRSALCPNAACSFTLSYSERFQ